MDNDSVINSRAGDVFHYRWATRRCLGMINPKSKIKYIMIEGSNEPTLNGELVMDVTEYSESGDGNSEDVAYFQLKHSVKRLDKCFELSGLKDTIEGFAQRFNDHENNKAANLGAVKFFVITNRPISTTFKEGILAIIKGEAADKRFQTTFKKYTRLQGEALQKFCASLELVDDEGNYADQKHELHFEMAKFFADTVEHTAINNVIALVQERVLPDAKHKKIVREDILRCFGVTNKDELFPAPPQFETLNHPIKREQHANLLDAIIQASTPVIITAGGGVGKSVVCCQLANSLPNGSVGIVYDCFGAGKYRNRSETRHQCNEALVQIANELAVLGLCETLMPQGSDKALLKAFLNRLRAAGKTLQQTHKDAILAIFIDAADNAEMAAKEFSESCFVHPLLREQLSTGCRIIALCRPERDHLLQLANTVQKIDLSAFSETETLAHLRKHFPNSSEHDALEFHRLTGGNPRVQANALSFGNDSIAKVLSSLGPLGMTVDDQIAAQLDFAIAKLKENHTQSFQPQIDSICLGLANLHPFIPVEVLAAAAEVDAATVKSFVADLGRPLWLSDDSVQFRDEPTETWFRKKFSASGEQIASYVTRLKPLAAQFPYVAGVLPSLLLQSGNYTELIRLALSDDGLPEDSPIDKRNVRVYRLQFAFKAALKQQRYADAAKLALRAGEEVAGDKRQLELLSKNTDLIAPLQSAQRVQELAFRRMLRGVWDGSENAYSAALLSTVYDFKGEARSYLRAAENLLRIYFEERETATDNDHHEQLKDEDIVELASARFNLFGTKVAVDFIQSWTPPEVIFRIARLFIRRLTDAGKFTAIDQIAQLGCRNVYLMLAITDELLTVGKFPPKEALRPCLVLLAHKRTRIKKIESHWGEDRITPAVASLAEASTGAGLCHTKILRVLKYYFPQRSINSVTSEHGREDERNAFLRGVALKAVLANKLEPDLETLMPKEWLERKNNYDKEQDITQFKQVVGGLLPWHILRARVLAGDKEDFDSLIRDADKKSRQARAQRYREFDHLPFEISQLRFEVLALNPEATDPALDDFVTQLSDKEFRFSTHHRLSSVRAAFRLEHLSGIKNQLERSCCKMIASAKDEQPETISDWYIDLARAVLATNPDDAKVYFDDAVEAVSKFGDELVERWDAVIAAAKRTAEGEHVLPETAYRFLRCTELVGDYSEEKHFDRNEAVEVCLKLHPESAFATLSRWRDRDVGWLNRQLPALAHEAVQSKIIAPSVAWSLSAFSWEYDYAEFAALCIDHEADAVRRQYILDTAVKDLRLKNTSEAIWQKIGSVAQRFLLENAELQHVLTFYAEPPKTNNEEKTNLHPARNYYRENLQPIDWTAVFANFDLTVSTGLSHAINRFDTMTAPRSHEEFWSEIYKRVPESEASIFLDVIVNAENADYYDVETALSSFPASWREKISVQRVWPKIINSVARRFAPEYANYYRANSLLRCICLEPNKLAWINEGILEGLSDSCNLVSASTLFGFTNVVSSYITPQEAADLLDFALGRFELHIDKNQYADGPWADWMIPPDSITDAFTGFVWSALASPRSEIRWRAVHCVRRLAEAGCKTEIDALINWMNQDKVDAFGSHKYPFYNLHARQYLLIAMARLTIDSPNLFRKHHAIFVQHALAEIPHALIQKYASEIALSIETAFPGTYDRDTIDRLRQIGSTPFPIQKIEGYGNTLKSPWHMQEEVDKNLKFNFSYDFDRYWFEPLADVFGISAQQVEELARQTLLNDWHIKVAGEYISDPRDDLWRSHRHERETWYSHYSYPKADNYDFYLSYHAMLAVAAKLLKEMPVVHRYDDDENKWLDWLNGHSLTRTDGHWLADRRDPAPLQRRAWIQEKKTDDWRWEIKSDDFLEGLLLERDGETWLNVAGHWNDSDGSREERFSIASALVSPATASSLLNALSTCSNPHDYKLPDYQEERMESKTLPFELQGWLHRESPGKSLDQFDPYAGDMDYPPYRIGEAFIEQFNFKADLGQREWHLPDTNKSSLFCELWSEKIGTYRDTPTRHGNHMAASLTFLKKLCADSERELIIEVQIERSYLPNSYNPRKDDEIEYPFPYCKIFILSANGTIRDTRTRYQLR